MPRERSPPKSLLKTCRCKQRVRFAEDESGTIKTTMHRYNHIKLNIEAQRLWWQREDFDRIRQEAIQVTDDVCKGDSLWAGCRKYGYGKCILKTYKHCSRRGSEDDLRTELRDDLLFWVLVGHSRRGLEKFMVNEVRNERETKRRKAIDMVLHVQDKCRDRGLGPYETMRLVGFAYEGQNTAGKQFAKVLGAVDAEAASVYYRDLVLDWPNRQTNCHNDERKHRRLPPQLGTKIRQRHQTHRRQQILPLVEPNWCPAPSLLPQRQRESSTTSSTNSGSGNSSNGRRSNSSVRSRSSSNRKSGRRSKSPGPRSRSKPRTRPDTGTGSPALDNSSSVSNRVLGLVSPVSGKTGVVPENVDKVSAFGSESVSVRPVRIPRPMRRGSSGAAA